MAKGSSEIAVEDVAKAIAGLEPGDLDKLALVIGITRLSSARARASASALMRELSEKIPFVYRGKIVPAGRRSRIDVERTREMWRKAVEIAVERGWISIERSPLLKSVLAGGAAGTQGVSITVVDGEEASARVEIGLEGIIAKAKIASASGSRKCSSIESCREEARKMLVEALEWMRNVAEASEGRISTIVGLPAVCWDTSYRRSAIVMSLHPFEKRGFVDHDSYRVEAPWPRIEIGEGAWRIDAWGVFKVTKRSCVGEECIELARSIGEGMSVVNAVEALVSEARKKAREIAPYVALAGEAIDPDSKEARDLARELREAGGDVRSLARNIVKRMSIEEIAREVFDRFGIRGDVREALKPIVKEVAEDVAAELTTKIERAAASLGLTRWSASSPVHPKLAARLPPASLAAAIKARACDDRCIEVLARWARSNKELARKLAAVAPEVAERAAVPETLCKVLAAIAPIIGLGAAKIVEVAKNGNPFDVVTFVYLKRLGLYVWFERLDRRNIAMITASADPSARPLAIVEAREVLVRGASVLRYVARAERDLNTA
ncbi:MAG: hypothetical protein GXO32_01855 [Crenarchaeota archaeon]|nr:hypothetical protein [Thermoproteota archaeon]